MNKILIAGHLGGDPETRFTPSGQKVTTFSVATKSREGKDREDVTIWWRVTVWGDRFDKMMTFLKKGSAVIVSGALRSPRTYVGKDGQTQVSLEVTADSIEFSPFGKTSSDGTNGQQQSRPAQAQSQPQTREPFGEQTFGGSAPSQGMAKQSMAVEEEEPPF